MVAEVLSGRETVNDGPRARDMHHFLRRIDVHP